jgi:N-hydroxyarylamine O-acetyltransferase
LRFDAEGVPQADPNGTFVLAPTDNGWVDLRWNGNAQYCYDPTPRALLTDFEPGRLHHTTSPESPFTQRTVCTLPTATGRVTVSNRTLIVTDAGQRTETELDDDALLDTYRSRFALPLDRLPTIPT